MIALLLKMMVFAQDAIFGRSVSSFALMYALLRRAQGQGMFLRLMPMSLKSSSLGSLHKSLRWIFGKAL